MTTDVDLRELAIDRGSMGQRSVKTRRHVLTRYVLPLILIVGFLSLVAWASRDLMFPPKLVTVVPVFSTTAEVRQEGTPLFQAAGWIEPRPTPIRVAALAPGVVETLLVVEDQPVKSGDAIAELVKDDAKLAHDRALADFELRQAELDEANAAYKAAETRFNQPVHLEAALGEANASLAKIETALKNLPFEIRRAEADHEAVQKDYEGKVAAEGVVAGVEIDIAKSKADSAMTLVEELRDRSQSLRKEQVAL
ncbi:MAG: biotin/lipoyl-binding protein, partial [Planctomycetales bacterium]|nr:biotin/lipoyl-binding protein [Planctomycetales bacterium]